MECCEWADRTGDGQVNRERIEYLSPPAAVQMADEWFDLASLKHFWIERRFEVFKRLAGHLFTGDAKVGEFGCGHGIVQRQCEDAFQAAVHGYDLNVAALEKNVSRASRLYCYDIHARAVELRQAFDILIMFDVIEHIDDDHAFVASAVHHLKPGGHLIVNVPALQGLYSAYDRRVGHVRRYDLRQLRAVAERNGLVVDSMTYWGLPLLPLLVVRKLVLGKTPNERTVRTGFHSGSSVTNALLRTLSRLEPVPQVLGGTSLMMVARRQASESAGLSGNEVIA